MQADVAEVDRLVVHVAAEEEAHVVGGVRTVGLGLLGRDELDVRVLLLEDVRDPRGHHADELAFVFQLEAFDVAEPADAVADRADRELDHDFLVRGVVVVREDRRVVALVVDDQAKPDEELLHAGDERARHGVRAVQDDASVDVRERHMVVLAVLREEDADAVVEVELDAFDRVQHRDLRDLTVDRRLFLRIGFLSGSKVGRAGSLRDRLRIRTLLRDVRSVLGSGGGRDGNILGEILGLRRNKNGIGIHGFSPMSVKTGLSTRKKNSTMTGKSQDAL